ncbi:MAG: hypothetical protein KA260_10280 [Burkholderiales bacterium]|nr:hypothetical protein [Burkholderiales bacterium]
MNAEFRQKLRRVLHRGEAVNARQRAIYTGRIASVTERAKSITCPPRPPLGVRTVFVFLTRPMVQCSVSLGHTRWPQWA